MNKRSRWGLAAVLILAVAAMAGCGSDKYADAKSLMKDQVGVTEDYVNGLEKAGSADEVAEVIDKYTDDMKALMPRIKAFHEKYPELSSFSASNDTPDDVKAEMQRLTEAMGKIQSATMKLMQYMMDPKVQQSFRRMGQELGQLGMGRS